MTKYYKINKELDIKVNKDIKNYLAPDYIYIPYYNDYELMIKNHEDITMNDVILKKGNNIIYSTISGKVIGLCEMYVDNIKQKCIVIENNFMENDKIRPSKKNIKEIDKLDLLKRVKELNAFEGTLKGDVLLISGIDIEPYEESLNYILSKHTDDLLECISTLAYILKTKRVIFTVKDSDSETIINLINQIGTYPDIDLKLVKDYYPSGMKELLIKEYIKKNEEVIFLNVNDVYNIYNVLRKNKPISHKLVTFCSNITKKSKVLNVKIGTSISEIIENEFKIKDESYRIIINGLLSGYEAKNANAIITNNVRSVFIVKETEYKQSKCINCGACLKYCPVGANPRSGYKMDKCIKCGLCSYLCPAKINLGGNNE